MSNQKTKQEEVVEESTKEIPVLDVDETLSVEERFENGVVSSHKDEDNDESNNRPTVEGEGLY